VYIQATEGTQNKKEKPFYLASPFKN